ncbi:hypothetical protein [Alkanindiges illinoisensis]|uniref:hypothetical protein n=1 Tax=Alkanindiges illinoisensis TaxID=197183 RepID=UPI00047DDFDF|nr:hypothetical protein [Alkanindiges illinoisensis]
MSQFHEFLVVEYRPVLEHESYADAVMNDEPVVFVDMTPCAAINEAKQITRLLANGSNAFVIHLGTLQKILDGITRNDANTQGAGHE